MSWIRPPAVAGQFYPAAPGALQSMVDEFLADAASHDEPCRALIAPHAGYIYSGPIAASAYACLVHRGEPIRRVVLLGPAHRVPVRGLAASSAASWATPLGSVRLDEAAIQELVALPQVRYDDRAHAAEHSLEVHLPFLQTVLADFALVPLVVGEATPQEVAEVLAHFAGDEATVLVISSDLSHYQEYERARALDLATSRAIEHLQPLETGQACGRQAINGLLHLARQEGWQAHTLDLRNSGDTAGPPFQVVGYGAYLFA
jgi:AmmeMemoRadiSam system protein B